MGQITTPLPLVGKKIKLFGQQKWRYHHYIMSKGNIIIVQKPCNMQITNLAFTFDIFTPPPPKKKTQYTIQTLNFDLWTQNQNGVF